MITIDSRGCGEGKTTSAIYPKLQKNLQTHQKTLIVVPSVKLQNQYDDFLTDPVAVVKINSYEKASDTDKLSVLAKISIAMENPVVYVIIITQAAFKMLNASPIRKSTWHLIIDEAFDPSRVIKYIRNKSNFDWSLCMKQVTTLTTAGAYIPFEIDEKYLDSFSWSDPIRNILDITHWRSYVSVEAFTGLMGDTANSVEIYQELHPDLVLGWASVHVAAAAFETTPMAKWFDVNSIPYTIKWPFVCRQLPIVLHLVANFDWSKNRATKFPEIADNFRTYVRNTCDDLGIDQVITLRNNSDSGTIENEERISHSPHGLNHLTAMTAISIESALNPTPGYKNFLTERFGMEDDIGNGRRDITRAFSSYLFYQSIMRTAARVHGNTQVVHVFVLDNKAAIGMMEYFEPQDIIDVPLVDIERINKQPGRPSINGVAMTPAERMKRAREKKRAEKTVTKTLSALHSSFVTADSHEPPRLAPQTNEDKLKEMLKSIKLGK